MGKGAEGGGEDWGRRQRVRERHGERGRVCGRGRGKEAESEGEDWGKRQRVRERTGERGRE